MNLVCNSKVRWKVMFSFICVLMLTALFSVKAWAVSVSTGDELISAINAAPTDGTEYTIEITEDINLTSGVSIPEDTSILIKSDGTNQHIITAASSVRHFSVKGSLTLENIILDGSSQSGTGGVYVDQGKITILDGAIIENCRPDSGGSGVGVQVVGGEFYMHGGEIRNNTKGSTTGTSGGGVGLYPWNSDDENTKSIGVMTGGSIHGNSNTWGGGIELGLYCEFTMEDGKIYENTATGANEGGGGVHVYGMATFTMNGGSIYGNNAANGAGVFVGQGSGVSTEPVDYSRFIMNGGSINGNQSTGIGGGIFITWNGQVEVNDGEIKGNSALLAEVSV